MTVPLEIPVGRETWRIELPPEKLLALSQAVLPTSNLSVRERVGAALEQPFQFEAMRRALTPNDRIAIVLDETLPQVAEGLIAILEHLGTAGIPPEAVTVLTAPSAMKSNWIDDLPDAFADVHTEVHDPTDRKKLAYLASTKSERRVYLNRTLVESDCAIVLSARRYDPRSGYTGPETAIFPTLSDDETRKGWEANFTKKFSTEQALVLRAETVEIAKLLGSTFFVQLVEDGLGGILDVIAGLTNSIDESIRRHDLHWRLRLDEQPDTIVLGIAGETVTFPQIARAAYMASRVVSENGRVVVLAGTFDRDTDGIRILQHCDDPKDARKMLAQVQPSDLSSCQLWAKAAMRAKLYVANLTDDEAEELFAYRVGDARALQKLLENEGRVLVVPNGDRSVLEYRG